MSNKFRVVADTNIVIAAKKSKSPTSPNREFFQSAGAGQFTILYTPDIVNEYIRKMEEHGISRDVILEFTLLFLELAEEVEIEFYHLPVYPADMDDVMFLLCALNGKASHLLSYDDHLISLAINYEELVQICKIVPFLQMVRKQNL